MLLIAELVHNCKYIQECQFLKQHMKVAIKIHIQGYTLLFLSLAIRLCLCIDLKEM